MRRRTALKWEEEACEIGMKSKLIVDWEKKEKVVGKLKDLLQVKKIIQKRQPPTSNFGGSSMYSTIGGTEVGSTGIPVDCKYSCKESTTPEVGFQYKFPETQSPLFRILIFVSSSHLLLNCVILSREDLIQRKITTVALLFACSFPRLLTRS